MKLSSSLKNKRAVFLSNFRILDLGLSIAFGEIYNCVSDFEHLFGSNFELVRNVYLQFAYIFLSLSA